jgi:dUTP pyrophosphatase
MSTGLPPVLKCLKLREDAKLPAKAHTGVFEDAAYDLYLPEKAESLKISPESHQLVDSGLKIIVPDGYWVKFHDRSGLAAKKGITVMGGVIDSGYTGEWKVILHNNSHYTQFIDPGQAMAQFTLEKINTADIILIDQEEFDVEDQKRQRGTSGFGSSDKK